MQGTNTVTYEISSFLPIDYLSDIFTCNKTQKVYLAFVPIHQTKRENKIVIMQFNSINASHIKIKAELKLYLKINRHQISSKVI